MWLWDATRCIRFSTIRSQFTLASIRSINRLSSIKIIAFHGYYSICNSSSRRRFQQECVPYLVGSYVL